MSTSTRKITWIVAGLLVFAGAVSGEVERIEITSRSVFAGGMEYGEVGPYEKIRGKLFYAVDPDNAANAAIVDLDLVPRGADGKVRFQGDFILLKPVDLAKGNGRLLYDVNNRGNLYMLRHINGGSRTNDPSSAEHGGNGFLMRQGYALLWSAWNWDVPADRAADRDRRGPDHPAAYRGRDRQQLWSDCAGVNAPRLGQQPLLPGPRRQ
jgi:hypothetical protein